MSQAVANVRVGGGKALEKKVEKQELTPIDSVGQTPYDHRFA
jgi:hypothetical protein